jgi:DNA-binding NarL/FixJ family response regulator
VERVLRHDFHGFLLASHAPESWAKAISAVGRGELWLPRAMLQKALSASARSFDEDRPAAADRPIDAATGQLTKREAQIVAQLRDGLSNKEIAVRLGVCEDTVKKHLQSVFGKLGVRRRALLMLGKAARPLHVV